MVISRFLITCLFLSVLFLLLSDLKNQASTVGNFNKTEPNQFKEVPEVSIMYLPRTKTML